MNSHEPRSPFGPRARLAALAAAAITSAGVGIWLSPASAVEASTDHPGKELRADLNGAKKLTGEERRDAVGKIHDKARDGEYGERAEQRAGRRDAHREAFFALLPEQMQADLTDAKAIDDEDDRKAKHDEIREKAVAGGYGEKVDKAFTILEESRPRG